MIHYNFCKGLKIYCVTFIKSCISFLYLNNSAIEKYSLFCYLFIIVTDTKKQVVVMNLISTKYGKNQLYMYNEDHEGVYILLN